MGIMGTNHIIQRKYETWRVKMKIGDLVYSEEFGKGKIVRIAKDELPYGIEFEKYNSELHDLDRNCKDGYGYWCTDDKSHNKPEEIITPYKFTKQDLQTGDKLTTRGGAELIYIHVAESDFGEIGDYYKTISYTF